MRQEDLLFWDADLRDYLEERKQALHSEVERTPEEHVLQAETDAWVKALVAKYKVHLPQLEEIWMDQPQETQVDVSYDHFRRAISDPSQPAYIPGYRVVLHAPFSGNPQVFSLKASSYTLNPPRGTARQDEITREIEYPHDTPVNLDAAAQALKQDLEHHLRFAEKDLASFEKQLESQARSSIQNRRQRVEEHKTQLAKTSVPIGPPSTRNKVNIVDAVVRKPSPALQLERKSEITLDPALEAEVYKHVLTVIRDTGLSMEKALATYAGMGEEERRDVFLNNLNTHYRGQTSAEAFNVSGKTDLLISYENKNLFIAECKIWSGQSDFRSAVDQLFSYAAWRDTKLALIVFVKQHGLTEVVEKARKALGEHKAFKSWETSSSETELPARMSWPGDESREINLNVFLFHLPAD